MFIPKINMFVSAYFCYSMKEDEKYFVKIRFNGLKEPVKHLCPYRINKKTVVLR